MAKTRLTLQELLEGILGSRHVYFQPPASVRMAYPAIVYARSKINNRYADNLIYGQATEYQITVIDEDPDSEIVKRVSQLPGCKWNRDFKADNLNHDVFTLCY